MSASTPNIRISQPANPFRLTYDLTGGWLAICPHDAPLGSFALLDLDSLDALIAALGMVRKKMELSDRSIRNNETATPIR